MKYEVIYADPPWQTGYLKGGKQQGTIGGGVALPYPTMTNAEIMSLPVREIAADNALLFMWVVDSRMLQIDALVKAWGFKYNSVGFVWNKTTKKDANKVRTTLSPYTRKSCELCLLGTRGRASKLVAHHYVLQHINWASQTRQHSVKPPEVRDRIRRLVIPDAKCIELFARQEAEGWDRWGNELENTIEL